MYRASHAEILALDEIVKNMKAKGKFNTKADLSKVKILVKGKDEWGNMCRWHEDAMIIKVGLMRDELSRIVEINVNIQ